MNADEIVKSLTDVESQTKEIKSTIDMHNKYTSDALVGMSTAIEKMADTQTEMMKQTVRFEEKQISESERSERIEKKVSEIQSDHKIDTEKINNKIENGLKDLDVKFEGKIKNVEDRYDEIQSDVNDNSLVRRATVWFTGAVVISMIGGGFFFNAINKNNQKQPDKQQEQKDARTEKR